jgi:hypothetical protein
MSTGRLRRLFRTQALVVEIQFDTGRALKISFLTLLLIKHTVLVDWIKRHLRGRNYQTMKNERALRRVTTPHKARDSDIDIQPLLICVRVDGVSMKSQLLLIAECFRESFDFLCFWPRLTWTS